MINLILGVIAVIIAGSSVFLRFIEKIEKKDAIIRCVIALAITVISISFKVIPTGYTGVRTTFGQIDENVLHNGLHFKIPFVQSIKTINNKQQDKKFEGEIWGEANDKTACFANNVIITYQINPDKSAFICANVNDYDDNLIPQAIVNSAVKSAMIQLPSDQVTDRSKIEAKTKEALERAISEKYGTDTVIVLKVTVDNMDYEESYNKAIAEKQIARQNAEKQAIENQKNIDLAKAEQEKAAAEAETNRIRAEGEAKAMTIAAEAEAEAYRIKSSQITENLLRKWELDARKEHGWVTIQGANTVVTNK